MKKILPVILTGIMMLSGTIAFAEDSSGIKAEETITQRTELAQLYDMGIMKDVGSGPYQSITRAEMAKIITQTLNISKVTAANTFTDVTDDNPYINEIGIVQGMKIMCGYGNDIFKPDADITYYEAAKTIVTMLGYEPIAQQNGGYPYGYLKAGNETGIIPYPGAEDRVINKNDIAKILIKAIDTPLMQQASFGSTAEYMISEDTIKTKYLNIQPNKDESSKKTLFDNYRNNFELLGADKENVLNYLNALEFVTPEVSGNQETYTEYVDGNDVRVMNMILYNGIVTGFEYEYHNLGTAYSFATYLRNALELTFGEKTTYPGMVQTNKDYFDNVKDVSELKSQYKYYEDWTVTFDNQLKENIDRMLDNKEYSRIDIRFELSVIDESKAFISVRYIALP